MKDRLRGLGSPAGLLFWLALLGASLFGIIGLALQAPAPELVAATQTCPDTQPPPPPPPPPVVQPPLVQNVPNYDSFRRNTLDLRGTYALNKNFDLTLGYAYDRFRYSDIQMDGYRYTVGGPAVTSTAFFSGAYAFQNYNANIVYATLKYNIQ